MATANDVRNEDWLRTRTWDLPTTVAGLEAVGIDIEKVLTLPAAEAMPPELRAEIEARLAGGVSLTAGSPDQPRDEQGRWTSGGGPERSESVPSTGGDIPIPPVTDPAARGPAVGEANARALRAGLDTESLHDKIGGQRGRYTFEREQIQDEIIRGKFQEAIDGGAERGKEAVLLAGLPGAGKTFATREIMDTSKYVVVSADVMKEELAARGLVDPPDGLNPMEASPLLHEESSMMAMSLAESAASLGYNVVWDMTMGKPASAHARIEELDDGGHKYTTTGVLVSVPIEQAAAAATERYERGLERDPATARYTPPEMIRQQFDPTGQFQSKNEAAFEAAKPMFDRWVVIDNTDFGKRIADQSHPDVIAEIR